MKTESKNIKNNIKQTKKTSRILKKKIQKIWTRIIQPDYRAFFEFMMWPILAVLAIGITTYSILLPAYKGEWIILFALLMMGPFLSIPSAAIIGSLTFISYGIWLFYTQMSVGLSASHFILLAMMPFAPIFLSATRLKIIDILHLATLLKLPQVRAAMSISDWSLLPSSRALEMRLKQHIEEYQTRKVPAVLVRFEFYNLDKTSILLGENVILHEVKSLADNLRKKLRSGDMIAEDIQDHSHLYVLAFPNPKSDYMHAIAKRLYPVAEQLEFRHNMDIAEVPTDGEMLFNINWHPIKDGEVIV